ncbi:MAG: DUF5398 family protein [Parachlamydiales bacterium]|nr:DUF5398 family protein [Parachlamydiales bacterium]
MYGLEKNRREKFHFDLEMDITKNPQKAQKMLEEINKKITHIKELLRKGSATKTENQKLGVLLQGYQALEKVINVAKKSK